MWKLAEGGSRLLPEIHCNLKFSALSMKSFWKSGLLNRIIKLLLQDFSCLLARFPKSCSTSYTNSFCVCWFCCCHPLRGHVTHRGQKLTQCSISRVVRERRVFLGTGVVTLQLAVFGNRINLGTCRRISANHFSASEAALNLVCSCCLSGIHL